MNTLTPPAPGAHTRGSPFAPGAVLTAADVARLPRTLATTDVDFELHDGRLVVMAPPGSGHGRRQARFAAFLFTHGEQRGHGEAFAEVGVLLRRNPDHLLGPDAAFLTAAQLPPRLSPEGYLLTVPHLVVEIRSKNDTAGEIVDKIEEYLAAGVVTVWVLDPERTSVSVHSRNQNPRLLTANESLTADGLIPEFAVPVSTLFAES